MDEDDFLLVGTEPQVIAVHVLRREIVWKQVVDVPSYTLELMDLRSAARPGTLPPATSASALEAPAALSLARPDELLRFLGTSGPGAGDVWLVVRGTGSRMRGLASGFAGPHFLLERIGFLADAGAGARGPPQPRAALSTATDKLDRGRRDEGEQITLPRGHLVSSAAIVGSIALFPSTLATAPAPSILGSLERLTSVDEQETVTDAHRPWVFGSLRPVREDAEDAGPASTGDARIEPRSGADHGFAIRPARSTVPSAPTSSSARFGADGWGSLDPATSQSVSAPLASVTGDVSGGAGRATVPASPARSVASYATSSFGDGSAAAMSAPLALPSLVSGSASSSAASGVRRGSSSLGVAQGGGVGATGPLGSGIPAGGPSRSTAPTFSAPRDSWGSLWVFRPGAYKRSRTVLSLPSTVTLSSLGDDRVLVLGPVARNLRPVWADETLWCPATGIRTDATVNNTAGEGGQWVFALSTTARNINTLAGPGGGGQASSRVMGKPTSSSSPSSSSSATAAASRSSASLVRGGADADDAMMRPSAVLDFLQLTTPDELRAPRADEPDASPWTGAFCIPREDGLLLGLAVVDSMSAEPGVSSSSPADAGASPALPLVLWTDRVVYAIRRRVRSDPRQVAQILCDRLLDQLSHGHVNSVDSAVGWLRVQVRAWTTRHGLAEEDVADQVASQLVRRWEQSNRSGVAAMDEGGGSGESRPGVSSEASTPSVRSTAEELPSRPRRVLAVVATLLELTRALDSPRDARAAPRAGVARSRALEFAEARRRTSMGQRVGRATVRILRAWFASLRALRSDPSAEARGLALNVLADMGDLVVACLVVIVAINGPPVHVADWHRWFPDPASRPRWWREVCRWGERALARHRDAAGATTTASAGGPTRASRVRPPESRPPAAASLPFEELLRRMTAGPDFLALRLILFHLARGLGAFASPSDRGDASVPGPWSPTRAQQAALETTWPMLQGALRLLRATAPKTSAQQETLATWAAAANAIGPLHSFFFPRASSGDRAVPGVSIAHLRSTMVRTQVHQLLRPASASILLHEGWLPLRAWALDLLARLGDHRIGRSVARGSAGRSGSRGEGSAVLLALALRARLHGLAREDAADGLDELGRQWPRVRRSRALVRRNQLALPVRALDLADALDLVRFACP